MREGDIHAFQQNKEMKFAPVNYEKTIWGDSIVRTRWNRCNNRTIPLQMEFGFRLFSHNRTERLVHMILKFQSHETQTDVRVRISNVHRTDMTKKNYRNRKTSKNMQHSNEWMSDVGQEFLGKKVNNNRHDNLMIIYYHTSRPNDHFQ